jgi:hypothetical protein
MKQTFLVAVLVAVGASVASAQGQQQQNGANVSALSKPVSPLSKPLSAIRGDPRVYDTVPPPRHSVWRSIQDPLDRSMGRIEDQPSYELGRIEQARQDRAYDQFRRREFDRFQEDRERELRLEDRDRRAQPDDERTRRRELDRREYLLYINAGYGPLAEQVERDRMALQAARTQRDQGLYEADVRLTEGLKQPGADRAALQRQYDQSRREVRERYEAERVRILGHE